MPSQFYYTAGILVFTNLGVIVSLIVVAFRATWWLSKLDSKVDEVRSKIVNAHKRIDKLEG